ncbi:MAG: YkgJ family cysteine cluster protein, partial [Methanomicrobiales archaeon]|nr:YkgJ family cysteine cluster protein [Methanomicrobiales archaeon]
NMQLVHTIREDRGNYTFVIYNFYSGDVKEVCVDADKIALYENRTSIENIPQACPFLRFDGEGKAWCTVHLTRPEVCRDYCCWRLVIRDARGRRVGRVLYQRTFLSDTPELEEIWGQIKPTLNGLSDQEWDDAVIQHLTEAGYHVQQ